MRNVATRTTTARMSDLIAKLRAEHPADFQGCDPSFDLRQEAADEIENALRELQCLGQEMEKKND